MAVAEDREAGHCIDARSADIDVDRIAERYPVPSGDGDVDQRIVRRSEIEIDERNGLSVAHDDILDAQVVVADDGSGRRSWQIDTIPRRVDRLDESGRSEMDLVLKPADALQQTVIAGPGRERWEADISFDEAEDAPTVLVGPEYPRRSAEADGLEMFEEVIHRLGERAMRAANGVTDANHAAARSHPSGKDDLGFRRHPANANSVPNLPITNRSWRDPGRRPHRLADKTRLSPPHHRRFIGNR